MEQFEPAHPSGNGQFQISVSRVGNRTADTREVFDSCRG